MAALVEVESESGARATFCCSRESLRSGAHAEAAEDKQNLIA